MSDTSRVHHPIVQEWLDGGNDAGGCIAVLERELAAMKGENNLLQAAQGHLKKKLDETRIERDNLHTTYQTAVVEIAILYSLARHAGLLAAEIANAIDTANAARHTKEGKT